MCFVAVILTFKFFVALHSTSNRKDRRGDGSRRNSHLSALDTTAIDFHDCGNNVHHRRRGMISFSPKYFHHFTHLLSHAVGKSDSVARKVNEEVIHAQSYDEGSNIEEIQHGQWKRIMLLVIAITVHNIPEGLAVGVGFGAIGSASTFEKAR